MFIDQAWFRCLFLDLRRKAYTASGSHGPVTEEGGSPEERREAVSKRVEIKHVNCSWEAGRGQEERACREREKGKRRKQGEGKIRRWKSGRPWETVSKDTWASVLG